LAQITDFSLSHLYTELDAQRQARGLSWAQATREMNGRAERPTAKGHALSASTVTGTRFRRVCEADGVLAMIRWLNRIPESFVPGHPWAEDDRARLPEQPLGKVLRFDTRMLHAALDIQRKGKGITWEQLAKEIGLRAIALMGLSKGGRTCFPDIMRVTYWLDRPAAEFIRIANR
jgi:hypothetical protein